MTALPPGSLMEYPVTQSPFVERRPHLFGDKTPATRRRGRSQFGGRALVARVEPIAREVHVVAQGDRRDLPLKVAY